MLGFNPYYYRIIRKSVVAFGAIFNELMMLKYDNDYTGTEQQRITVPIAYSDREDYITRFLDNPDLSKTVQVQLPRMSYRITGIRWDPNRKMNAYDTNFLKNTTSNANGTFNQVSTQWQGQPYDIDFELNIYVRNQEDGAQLIEQILPFFNPDLTLTINFVPQMNITRNVPIFLRDLSYDCAFEGAAIDEVRYITYTLNFTMKTWFYGPVITGGLINKVIERYFQWENAPGAPQIELFIQTPIVGNYEVGEIVYQGSNLPDANIQGNVAWWDATSGRMLINVVSGTFVVSVNAVGSLSGASGTVINTTPDLLLANVVVSAVANSNAQTAFGWVSTTTEWPNT